MLYPVSLYRCPLALGEYVAFAEPERGVSSAPPFLCRFPRIVYPTPGPVNESMSGRLLKKVLKEQEQQLQRPPLETEEEEEEELNGIRSEPSDSSVNPFYLLNDEDDADQVSASSPSSSDLF